MESPRIVLLLSTLVVLICIFSQVITSDGKDHANMIPTQIVKSNKKIQALGKFAIIEINEETKRYFQFYWLPNVEYTLLSFNEVYAAKHRWEDNRAIRYMLYIQAQTGKGLERRLIAYVRTVGDSKELLQSYYIY